MKITHPNLKLAFCGLLATSLLTACGGGSSSSAGTGAGTDSRTYQQGYARGTVDTVDTMLDDLRRLQASLAGTGAPAQTSRGTLGRSFNLLEPRQRGTLATALATYIAQVEAARDAAAAATAGTAEAEAAQAAANAALQALQLVVAADTAARVSGLSNSQAAQDAAIRALTRIGEVDPEASDAQEQINTALGTALTEAQAAVDQLAAELARTQAQLGQQEGSNTGVVNQLQQQLTAAEAARDAARAGLNELTPRFGSSPGVQGATASRTASTTYHPRRTGVQVWFARGNSNARDNFDPTKGWPYNTRYTIENFGDPATGGIDLDPDAVPYRSGNRRVFAATSPNTAHFPGRGKVYRGELRFVRDGDTNANNNHGVNDWIYGVAHRLIEQGVDAEPCSGAQDPADGMTCPSGTPGDGNPSGAITSGKQGAGGTPDTATNAGRWNNWDAAASMTFQYKADGGFTMGFGGTGVIFGDLERYAAKGEKNCGTNSDEYCDEPGTANVEISFGAPQADPYGVPDTNYWNVRTPSPRLPGVAAADSQANAITPGAPNSGPGLDAAGDQIEDHDMGRYELLLSSYAGADRRLAYAAYGLFNFVDTATATHRVGRMQLFHYGLDAFADDDGRRPTDLTGNDVLEGTFRGHTTAWIVTSSGNQENTARFNVVQNLFRTRGNLEMRACIGAADTSCTIQNFASTPSALAVNTVTGRITDLEYAWQNRPGGYWTKRDGGIGTKFLQNENARVELYPAAIQPDGTYAGVAVPDNIDGGRRGVYEGAFYGPAGAGLETAGTWQINIAAWHETVDAIIGSFGAVCEGTCKPEPPASQ